MVRGEGGAEMCQSSGTLEEKEKKCNVTTTKTLGFSLVLDSKIDEKKKSCKNCFNKIRDKQCRH